MSKIQLYYVDGENKEYLVNEKGPVFTNVIKLRPEKQKSLGIR